MQARVSTEMQSPASIAERIRRAILEHRLAPGAKLTEAQLCEVFAVKRGTVRQALALLANEHLVDLEPNRGAFVASPTLEEVHEVFEMRRIIESAVVGTVCREHGAAHSRKLSAIGATIERETQAFARRDLADWIRLSGEFHTELAALTGNSLLCECLGGLVARTTLISALYDSAGRSPCSFDDHAEILAALESGDVSHATQLMQRHLQVLELKMFDRPSRDNLDLKEIFGTVSS
jgi:DNA-binding GntR family transcriptional regulator